MVAALAELVESAEAVKDQLLEAAVPLLQIDEHLHQLTHAVIF